MYLIFSNSGFHEEPCFIPQNLQSKFCVLRGIASHATEKCKSIFPSILGKVFDFSVGIPLAHRFIPFADFALQNLLSAGKNSVFSLRSQIFFFQKKICALRGKAKLFLSLAKISFRNFCSCRGSQVD